MDVQMIIGSYATCIGKYADFTGIAKRAEFWPFCLVNAVINMVITPFVPLLGSIFCLAIALPSMASTARRLHDIQKTGWLQLLWLVPIVGWIVMIYLLVQPSRT